MSAGGRGGGGPQGHGRCPHCGTVDPTLREYLGVQDRVVVYRCEVCSKVWWERQEEREEGERG